MLKKGNTAPLRPQALLDSVGSGIFEAPAIGALWLAWVPEGLTILRFGAEPAPEAERRRWWPEACGELRPRAVPSGIAATLERYFGGESVDPATIPARIGGTAFQQRVWRALRAVKRGEVQTYAGLGGAVGAPRAMRAVGAAMAANPLAIVVPCHRVVGAGYRIGGYSGGLDRKRLLLGLEGVSVDGDGVFPGQLALA